jgi:hypothetical protein
MYNMRFPTSLKRRVEAYADLHGRSLNAEIVMALREKYDPSYTQNGMSSFSVDAAAGAPGGEAGESAGAEE